MSSVRSRTEKILANAKAINSVERKIEEVDEYASNTESNQLLENITAKDIPNLTSGGHPSDSIWQNPSHDQVMEETLNHRKDFEETSTPSKCRMETSEKEIQKSDLAQNNEAQLVSKSSSSDSNSDDDSSSSSSSSTISEDKDDDIVDKDYVLPTDNKNQIFPNTISSSSSDNNSDLEEELPIEETKEKNVKKRKSNPNSWARTKAKILRNTGKEYTSTSKKTVKERTLGPTCNEKCIQKCSTKILGEQRRAIFDDFWKLGNIQRQREFVLRNLEPVQPKYVYRRENSNRKLNHAFYFTINNKKIRVCKVFLKNTLSITDRFIRTVTEKKSFSPTGILELDGRGKHSHHRKTPSNIMDGIREHIDSIPRMESHYCRKDTKKDYIEGGRTLMDLYRDYLNICNARQILSPANYQIYARTFNYEYNISFFSPKKDQCEDCVRYENAKGEEKLALQAGYEHHQKEKELSRQSKEQDKQLSKEDSSHVVAVFDLQAVLQCPRGDVSTFYYISKINAFNFTICNLKVNDVTCFTWDETQGKRGANEIATCIWMYIGQLEDQARSTGQNLDVVFYSDNCCGQNKNRFVFLMYDYALRKYESINSITHKFLVKGHTQNEGDSAHALIQREITKSLKCGLIYTPQQYISMMRVAKKKGNPYVVREMSYQSFLDFKSLANKIKSAGFTDINNENVRVSDISILCVTKDAPQKILFKYSYSEAQFREINLSQKRNTRGSGLIATSAEGNLMQLYQQPLNLDNKKKEGLLKLVEKNIIPKFYQNYYSNL